MHRVFWVVILLSYVATVLKSQLLESGIFLYESQLTKKATSFISVQGNFKDETLKAWKILDGSLKNKGLSL